MALRQIPYGRRDLHILVSFMDRNIALRSWLSFILRLTRLHVLDLSMAAASYQYYMLSTLPEVWHVSHIG